MAKGVSGGPFSLEADGWTLGRCGVYLWPIFLYRPNVGNLGVELCECSLIYRWEGNGSRDMTSPSEASFIRAAVTYTDMLSTDTHVSVDSCSSGLLQMGAAASQE
jgi:hypothetical protein